MATSCSGLSSLEQALAACILQCYRIKYNPILRDILTGVFALDFESVRKA
jgi:hypothetical protein